MGFSVASALRFGWETFKKRPWFFAGAFLLIALAQVVIEGISRAIDAPFGGADSDQAFLGSLASLALSTLVSMGITAFGLAAHDQPETVEFSALWHPRPFWKYLGLSLVFALIAVAGVLGFFLIVATLGSLFGRGVSLATLVPVYVVLCVILFLIFMFATFSVIDREFGPIKALQESYHITRRHLWDLFVLSLLLFLINLAGLLALVVGLLVSAPVSLLALAHAYRVLSGTAGAAPPADAALAA